MLLLSSFSETFFLLGGETPLRKRQNAFSDSHPFRKGKTLMRGKVPINMQMIHEIWLKCDGASRQLQSTKLTSRHFDRNAYSRMNIKLATQLL